ncbi:MAG: dihydrofolate reductase [Chitinophagales bacterium]
MPIFSAIVAASENDVIGLNGDMPWAKMRSDLKFFKDKTMGKWCILGRKSYNALGNKVLPGRKFIVVTRNKDFIADDSIVVHDIENAIHHPELNGEEEVMILGGGEIFNIAWENTDRIYLTRIHAAFQGDTFFPVPDPNEWILTAADDHPADDRNPHTYTFLVYDRK